MLPWAKAPFPITIRGCLRVFTALTLGIFVFVAYFANVQVQRVKLVDQAVVEVAVSGASRCVLPMHWSGQSSKYTVLYNVAPADTRFGFDDSVTYTTHGTAKFLAHAEAIARRWGGPLSVAVYAPGDDFAPTLSAIQWLRSCGHPAIRQLATFHVFFDREHSPSPSSIPCTLEDLDVECGADPTAKLIVPSEDSNSTNAGVPKTYQEMRNLTYPVNVARNIARISAQTRYVLPSDIELYPSTGIPSRFLRMIHNSTANGNLLTATNKTNSTNNPSNSSRSVFVLPIFEVDSALTAPENKSSLVALLKEDKVVPFHKFVCAECHRVPKQTEWVQQVPTDTESAGIFFTTKRHKPYHSWEPIYIGTNDEPLYDERLNWEGMSDKMTQAYELCLMDYSFNILDNAFLVHAPGIKHVAANKWRSGYVQKNNDLRKQIKKELTAKYKPNGSCFL